jgi:thymidylate synthase
MMFRPVYRASSLLLGDPASPVGVVTLWTLKEKVAARLDPADYAAIGQLYSPTQGLDYLVRNLLANPSIRYLVLTGQDLSGSGAALRAFFELGVREGTTGLGVPCWRIPADVESFVGRDVEGTALERLRRHVRLVVCPDRADLRALIRSLPADAGKPTLVEPLLFPRREPVAGAAVGEGAVYVVRGGTVAEAWVQLLHAVWTFGRICDTQYDGKQKEVLDLVSVISDEDPDRPFLPDYLPCTPAQLERYLPTVLTADAPRVAESLDREEVRYTYGQRLRAYFGVDQIEDVVASLARDPRTRAAAASLWDPRTDHVLGGPPCLNHLWFRIVDRAPDRMLTLTATLRSNDVYKAWPENALALRKLQAAVRAEVMGRTGTGLDLGDLVVISESAHVYDDDWEATQHVLARQYPELAARLRERRDPRGNFLVEIGTGIGTGTEQGALRVERLAPSGEHVQYYHGRSAGAIVRQLEHDAAVSSVEHALYLGAELQKAELALRHPDLFRYVQDRPLERLG